MPDKSKSRAKSGGQLRARSTRYQPPPPVGPSLSRFKENMAHKAKWIMTILLGLIVVGSVAFFAGAPYGNMNSGASDQSSATDVVVKVDGNAITRGDVDRAVSQQQDMMRQFGQPPQDLSSQPAAYSSAVQQLVKNKVEEQAAHQSNVRVTTEEYNKELGKLVDQQVQRMQSSFKSPADFQKYLETNGKSMKTYRDEVTTQLYDRFQQQNLDLHDLLNKQITVQNFKDQYEQKLTLPKFVRYSQIVISNQPPTTPGQKGAPSPAASAKADAAAQARADAIFKQVQGGANFADLAKKDSTADSKSKGGDEGWVNPAAPGSADYLKGLASARVGDILPVAKSSDGYHIIKVTGVTTSLPKDFNRNTDYALASAADDQYQKYLDGLVKKANVQYQDPAIQGAIAQLKPDMNAALAFYNKALKKGLGPTERGWVAYAAGQILMTQNAAKVNKPQVQQALSDFTVATRTKPDSADAWLGAGDAQSKLGNKKAALDDYKRALDFGTGNSGVLTQLTSRFGDLKDAADAQTAAQAAQMSQQNGMGGMFGGGITPGPNGTFTLKTPPAGKPVGGPIKVSLPARTNGPHPVKK